MKILSSSQIKEIDLETINLQKITSLELMERASRAFVTEFRKYFDVSLFINVVCGTGNNGGDGLAVARMLHQEGYDVKVIIIDALQGQSPDFKANLSTISKQIEPILIKNAKELSKIIKQKTVIIDGIFGSGLNRPLEEPHKEIIEVINNLKCQIVSIDIASGLFADTRSLDIHSIIKPCRTISFEIPKLAFFMEENEAQVGDLSIVDIGLDKETINKKASVFETIEENNLEKYIRPKHGHKGTFGHALLVSGQEGMMGAAVLAAKACMRGGVGKTTVHTPANGLQIMQMSVPEAIIHLSENEKHLSTNWDNFNFEPYDAFAIGPGIGQENISGFRSFIKNASNKKLIIDADGINILGSKPELLDFLPENTILTPHPKEFKTLTQQTWKNDFEKIEVLRTFSSKHNLIICLKGHHTAIALPTGQVFFNTTGNNGMATAGSGDVLTGLMLAYLAQKMEPSLAAKRAVLDHGTAGDRAAANRSEKSMIASDIIEFIR